MLETSTICFPVSNVHWNCASTSTKYCWFVHVIPNVVSLVRSFKVFVFELISPKILSILIKEIYPSWVTWPTVTIEISKIRISYKNIRQISNWLLSVLKCDTIRVNIVSVTNFYMRINNDCNISIAFLNFFIHLLNLPACKVLRVEDKKFSTINLIIFVCPLIHQIINNLCMEVSHISPLLEPRKVHLWLGWILLILGSVFLIWIQANMLISFLSLALLNFLFLRQ